VIFALSAFLAKPRDPGHRPHHHSPYAQNSLICLPKTRIVIDYRRRQNGGYARAVVKRALAPSATEDDDLVCMFMRWPPGRERLGRPYGEVPAVRGSFSVRPPAEPDVPDFPASGSLVTYAVAGIAAGGRSAWIWS